MTDIHFGAVFRRARQEAKLTQKEAAKRLGTSVCTISSVETRDEWNNSLPALERCLEIFRNPALPDLPKRGPGRPRHDDTLDQQREQILTKAKARIAARGVKKVEVILPKIPGVVVPGPLESFTLPPLASAPNAQAKQKVASSKGKRRKRKLESPPCLEESSKSDLASAAEKVLQASSPVTATRENFMVALVEEEKKQGAVINALKSWENMDTDKYFTLLRLYETQEKRIEELKRALRELLS